MNDFLDLLHPLEDVIQRQFITGQSPPSDVERALLAIPVHLGGLGLANPTTLFCSSYQASRKLTRPLLEAIATHNTTSLFDASETTQLRKEIHNHNQVALPWNLQYCVELAGEKGASSWLSVVPWFLS